MAGAGGNRIARSGSLSDIWFVAGEDRVVCGLPVHHPYSMYLCGVLFSGCRTKYEVVHFLRKTGLPAGLVVMVIMVPALLHSLSDPAAIGPNIAVMVLTLLYAAVAYLVLYVAETRMERRRKQN